MNLLANIKAYFENKQNNQPTADAPEGICPNCWGKQEWDGQFYEIMKGDKNEERDNRYKHFISKFVEENLEGIKIKEDTYECTTCQFKYNH